VLRGFGRNTRKQVEVYAPRLVRIVAVHGSRSLAQNEKRRFEGAVRGNQKKG
jgi:hypothetical protein